MPKWIHDRADHIRAKNPGMSKSQSFAIATQQSYAAGKAPKGYGTSEGRREAKQKYDEPKAEYKKTAMAESLRVARINGFLDELQKISSATPPMVQNKKRSMTTGTGKLPNKTSSPVIKEPDPPAAVLDHLRSSRTIQPPPVTAA